MLRPIVGLALRHGLGIHELLEGLKAALVAEARQQIAERGEKVNVSRVSVATGMHRREVDRVLQEGDQDAEPVNLASRLVSTWEHSADFCTKGGKPRILSLDGPESDFSHLVRRVTKDVHPRGVLVQLERLGMVEHVRGGLRLTAGAQNIRADLGKAYHVLAQDLSDLTAAVEYNVLEASGVPNLHARTEFDNVFQDSIPEIREWLLKEGSEFHKRAREYLGSFDADLNPHIRKEAGCRIVLTSFGKVEIKI